MKIAVLLTCFNRRDYTLSCLKSLFTAQKCYNEYGKDKLNLEVFLVDDGSKDGTSDAIRHKYDENIVHIIEGTGSLYWAGGMRLSWKTAMERHEEWDFYLLVNDDTDFSSFMFNELFSTHEFSIKQYGKEGIYSGVIASKNDYNQITYGGNIYINKFLAKTRRLRPIGVPQMCDTTTANILLVPVSVVDKIGIFYDGYIHGSADYDYAAQARKHDIPALITGKICGYCLFDHVRGESYKETILGMSKAERKKYRANPVTGDHDYLLFMRRTAPLRYPILRLVRYVFWNFPKLYFSILGVRQK